MKKRKIRLGDYVQCKYSGLIGYVVAKTEFINKCIQYEIQPKVSEIEKNKYPESVSIDEDSLIILDKKKIKMATKKENYTGGRTNKYIKFKGY